MKINKKEIYRYLGYKGNTPTDDIVLLVDECLGEILKVMTPKTTHKVFDLILQEDKICFATMQVKSQNLAKNLEGCNKIVVFAATLGVGVDMLINKATRTQIAKAVIYQACAAMLIEEVCDELNYKIECEYKNLKPRFSAGYGDFDISHQKDILELLETYKKIGLSYTESFMLVPTKSVTAVIGVSEFLQEKPKNKCLNCENKTCEFRNEE